MILLEGTHAPSRQVKNRPTADRATLIVLCRFYGMTLW